MENIAALQAIDRGEKPDQDTLLALNEARLVEVADVTNMQSSGREYIFVGFTPEGLRLLKASKNGPLVSDAEKEILLSVIRRFLDEHRATSGRELLKKFKTPVSPLLQRLGNQAVLQVKNNTYLNETYLPKTVAFYPLRRLRCLSFCSEIYGTRLACSTRPFRQRIGEWRQRPKAIYAEGRRGGSSRSRFEY
jgi:hypothetical protein